MPADHPVWGPPPACPNCSQETDVAKWQHRAEDAEAQVAETTDRLREALAARDSARAIADRRASLHHELADALGVAHLQGEKQLTAALTAIRALTALAGE